MRGGGADTVVRPYRGRGGSEDAARASIRKMVAGGRDNVLFGGDAGRIFNLRIGTAVRDGRLRVRGRVRGNGSGGTV